jgi:hypothetical protein
VTTVAKRKSVLQQICDPERAKMVPLVPQTVPQTSMQLNDAPRGMLTLLTELEPTPQFHLPLPLSPTPDSPVPRQQLQSPPPYLLLVPAMPQTPFQRCFQSIFNFLQNGRSARLSSIRRLLIHQRSHARHGPVVSVVVRVPRWRGLLAAVGQRKSSIVLIRAETAGRVFAVDAILKSRTWFCQKTECD